MAKWASNLCRPDITHAVQQYAMFQAKLRKNQLQAMLRVWEFIKMFLMKVIFVNLRPTKFLAKPHDVNVPFLKEIYPDAEELMLPVPDTDEVMGDIQLWAYVNAGLHSDKQNEQACTGVVVCIGNILVLYISKMQMSVKTSTYGAEFAAMKKVIEELIGVCAMLREMGFTIGVSRILCDNAAFVTLACNLNGLLKRCLTALAYHLIQETLAIGTVEL